MHIDIKEQKGEIDWHEILIIMLLAPFVLFGDLTIVSDLISSIVNRLTTAIGDPRLRTNVRRAVRFLVRWLSYIGWFKLGEVALVILAQLLSLASNGYPQLLNFAKFLVAILLVLELIELFIVILISPLSGRGQQIPIPGINWHITIPDLIRPLTIVNAWLLAIGYTATLPGSTLGLIVRFVAMVGGLLVAWQFYSVPRPIGPAMWWAIFIIYGLVTLLHIGPVASAVEGLSRQTSGERIVAKRLNQAQKSLVTMRLRTDFAPYILSASGPEVTIRRDNGEPLVLRAGHQVIINTATIQDWRQYTNLSPLAEDGQWMRGSYRVSIGATTSSIIGWFPLSRLQSSWWHH